MYIKTCITVRRQAYIGGRSPTEAYHAHFPDERKIKQGLASSSAAIQMPQSAFLSNLLELQEGQRLLQLLELILKILDVFGGVIKGLDGWGDL